MLAKIGADTAENEQKFDEHLPKIGNYPTDPLPNGRGAPKSFRRGGGLGLRSAREPFQESRVQPCLLIGREHTLLGFLEDVDFSFEPSHVSSSYESDTYALLPALKRRCTREDCRWVAIQ